MTAKHHKKFGTRSITPFLGTSTRIKTKVQVARAIRTDEERVADEHFEQLGEVRESTGIIDPQFSAITPHVNIDMALVLVLVQDNTTALNSVGGSSKRKLPPPTPNSE